MEPKKPSKQPPERGDDKKYKVGDAVISLPYTVTMRLLRKEKGFLTQILRQANRFKRQQMLMHAKKDQINAMSEMVLNLLKNKIPVAAATLRKLKPHKNVLRELAKRKNSLKTRRAHLVEQQGSGLWKGLGETFRACHCKR